MKKTALLIALLLIPVLVGCPSTKMLSPKDQVMISKIYINEIVEAEGRLAYMGNGATAGLLGILLEDNATPSDQLRKLALENDIQIEKMAKIEIDKILSNSDRYTITDRDVSDATLNIRIRSHIMQHQNGFSDKVVTVLCLVFNLTDRSDKVIWQQIGGSSTNKEAYTLKELFEDPNRLRRLWQEAVALSVSKAFSKL